MNVLLNKASQKGKQIKRKKRWISMIFWSTASDVNKQKKQEKKQGKQVSKLVKTSE